ncbi:ABC transporter permease [Acuticoccus kandeliae]|uniref:ABC transporter permease n=1 Tax=Acuticoccus kandeliae TaxID=2073160 RepID=UPI000D3E7719|nr:ABC transporter permease [Acuticoccus kandeliae]
MLAFVLRRVLVMIPTMILISIIVFAVIQLPPGDYLDTLVSQMASQGDRVDDAQLAALRARYGLDQPLVVQYLNWITGIVLHGDFGQSFEWNKPIAELIMPRLGLTLGIASTVLVLTGLIAIPIGVYSAVRQYSLGDHLATLFGFIGLAIPNVLLTLGLLYFTFVTFGLEPGGLFSREYQNAPWSFGRVLDLAAHLWIPITVLTLAGTAEVIRVMRATMLDELVKPYVETARAKGLSEARLIARYPVRIALNPIVSKLGWMMPIILSSEAIVSVIVDIPTTGPLLLRALLAQDMYLAGAIILMLAAITVIGTLVSDVLLAVIDPRIRYS